MRPIIGWKPDSMQPLPPSGMQHVDPSFNKNITTIQSYGSAVANPGVEANGVLDLRHWCPPIDDQGRAEDCVANATTGALEFLQIRNGLPFVKLSRLFLYYNARIQTRDQCKDEGTYIRLAFSTLTTLGTCTEDTWPYDLSQIFVRPSWRSYTEAFPNRTSAFYRIEFIDWQMLRDMVKMALAAQHPVVFGMTVDDNYVNHSGSGPVAMPVKNRPSPGGHAQTIVGYDDNLGCWIVRNSWGTGWADNGYALVPYEYLEESDANDFWVPVLARAADNTTVTVTHS